MKLYKKGERRYTEAKESEILTAAAAVLSKHKIEDPARMISGMSVMLKAFEDTEVIQEIKREKSQKAEDRTLSKPPMRPDGE